MDTVVGGILSCPLRFCPIRALMLGYQPACVSRGGNVV